MRHSIVHMLVLVFVALASLTSAQSSSGSTSATIVAHNSTIPTAGSLSKTQCEICRDTGVCSDASSGTPSHLCYEYKYPLAADKIACCCSTSSTCPSYDNAYRCVCDPKVFQTSGVYAGVRCLIALVLSIAFFMQPVYVQSYPQEGYDEGGSVRPVYNQRGNGQLAYM